MHSAPPTVHENTEGSLQLRSQVAPAFTVRLVSLLQVKVAEPVDGAVALKPTVELTEVVPAVVVDEHVAEPTVHVIVDGTAQFTPGVPCDEYWLIFKDFAQF